PGFLDTLPRREVRSGFAEIVKHSLIADSRQWDQLREIVGIDRHDWPSVIEDSLRVKYDIVIRDPFEKSIRKALNFGHTIGHAVESRSLDTDRPLLHGEAIGIGMICESYLSSKKKGLSEDHLHQITQYLLHHYGHYELKSGSESELIALMKNDKKNVGDAISFSLISEPGTVHVDEFCEEELIRESLTYYREMV
ncbi:MAG: 3-dehydroquinate synthase, partial [Saprospiraceae bacterium]|nr:3-dehydroquinate synthase [Saprospiraceae bacterium]